MTCFKLGGSGMFDQEAAWAHNQDYFCSFLFKKVLKTDAKLDPDQETAHGLHLMQNKNGRGRTILDLETQLPKALFCQLNFKFPNREGAKNTDIVRSD